MLKIRNNPSDLPLLVAVVLTAAFAVYLHLSKLRVYGSGPANGVLFYDNGGARVAANVLAKEDGAVECKKLVLSGVRLGVPGAVKISPAGDVECKTMTVRDSLDLGGRRPVLAASKTAGRLFDSLKVGDYLGVGGPLSTGGRDGLLLNSSTLSLDLDETSFSAPSLLKMSAENTLVSAAPLPAAASSNLLSHALEWVPTPPGAFYTLGNEGVAGQVLRFEGGNRLGFVDPPLGGPSSFSFARLKNGKLMAGKPVVETEATAAFVGIDADGNFLEAAANDDVKDSLVLYDQDARELGFLRLPSTTPAVLTSGGDAMTWTSGHLALQKGAYDVAGLSVSNASPATRASHAVTYGEVAAKCLSREGDVIDAKNRALTNVADPVEDADLLTEAYARRLFPRRVNELEVSVGGLRVSNLPDGEDPGSLLSKERVDETVGKVMQRVQFAAVTGTTEFEVCKPRVSSSEYVVTHACELNHLLAYGGGECKIYFNVGSDRIMECVKPAAATLSHHPPRKPSMRAGDELTITTDRTVDAWMVVALQLEYDAR